MKIQFHQVDNIVNKNEEREYESINLNWLF